MCIRDRISSELVYLSGAVILAFATALLTASDLGQMCIRDRV